MRSRLIETTTLAAALFVVVLSYGAGLGEVRSRTHKVAVFEFFFFFFTLRYKLTQRAKRFPRHHPTSRPWTGIGSSQRAIRAG